MIRGLRHPQGSERNYWFAGKCITNNSKSHFKPPFKGAERGLNVVKVGEVCGSCKFWSRRSKSCDYRLRMGSSRCITNNIRIDPTLCDKYEEGESNYDKREWKDKSFKYLY